MTIYERIRELRLGKGMSQEELARLVGYEGRSAISKVEKGERDISQSMIGKYAAALGVSTEYLMNGREAETAEKSESEQIREVLLDGDPGISEDAIREIRNYAQYILQRERQKRGEKN